MDSIQKFISDIERIKKRARQDGAYSGEQVGRTVQELFDKNNRALGEVAHSVSDYWFESYIRTSVQPDEEPAAQSIQKLAAMQAMLDGEEALTDSLSPQDWKALCQIVSAEAEDIPLDTLNTLMSQFVDHQAL